MPVLVAAFAVVFVPLIVLAFTAGRGTSSDSGRSAARGDRARALDAYGDALAPAVTEAGAAVVLGIRPDIPDFQAGHITADVWQNDMEARARQFASAEATFRSAPAPSGLAAARATFLDAFADYRLAVVALHAAGGVNGADRDALISLGASIGERGDHTFDRGAAAVQAARRAAGLAPDSRMTDPQVQP